MRLLGEFTAWGDRWILLPSFPERLVRVEPQESDGAQFLFFAEARSSYPISPQNHRLLSSRFWYEFVLAENLYPEKALAVRCVPIDYKNVSSFVRFKVFVDMPLYNPPPNSEQIEVLQAAVDEHDAAIATLQQANTSQDSAIATLQADLATVEGGGSDQAAAIASLQQANASQDGAIASLQSSVSSINSTNTSQSSAIASLQSQVTALTANLNWANLTLINNWTNFGTPFGNAQYAKSNGWVFLRGVVFGGNSSNALLATLPTGFRPVIRVLLDCATIQTNYAGYAPGRLDVEPNGNISNFGSANFVVSLDGLAFYVGN